MTGTFGAVAGLSSLAFLTPVLSYDADDVYLGFSREDRPAADRADPDPTPLFATVAQTPKPDRDRDRALGAAGRLAALRRDHRPDRARAR